jgi:benzoyl-CoA reductase/2-hydroxyglutaryl-CoA dehydratase subunit BcrC/BadD/HgdB
MFERVSRITYLRTENERLEDQIEELRNRKVDESTIEDLIGRLHGQYWNDITGAMEMRV